MAYFVIVTGQETETITLNCETGAEHANVNYVQDYRRSPSKGWVRKMDKILWEDGLPISFEIDGSEYRPIDLTDRDPWEWRWAFKVVHVSYQ